MVSSGSPKPAKRSPGAGVLCWAIATSGDRSASAPAINPVCSFSFTIVLSIPNPRLTGAWSTVGGWDVNLWDDDRADSDEGLGERAVVVAGDCPDPRHFDSSVAVSMS